MNEEDVRAWNAAYRQLDAVAPGASAFVDKLFVPSLTGRIPADEVKAALLNWVRSFDNYHAQRLPDEQATAIAVAPMLPTPTTTTTTLSTSSASRSHARVPLAMANAGRTNLARMGSSGRIGALQRLSGLGRR